MKHKLIFFLMITLFSFSKIQGQSASQSSTPWFSTKELSPNVWVIDDNKAANIYLVIGRDSALVIDAGIGAADLSAVVKKLTSKPIIVVNTHAHPDHSGANYQFEKVYVNAADSSEARRMGTPAQPGSASPSRPGAASPPAEELYNKKPYFTKLVALEEGHIFNLGDRRLKVMALPGHTPGSIALLDVENKLLFTGDSNNPMAWLFLSNCLPLHVYLKTLENEKQHSSEFTTLFPGHGGTLPADFIDDQIACVKAILDGSCESRPFNSGMGEAKVCSYGRATIAYNPNNL